MKSRCANKILSFMLSLLLLANTTVITAFASDSSSGGGEPSERHFSTRVTLVVEGVEAHTVTCDPNSGKWDDGTSGKKPLEVEDGKPFTVPDAPTPPPGKEFGGWLDDKGNIHQPGEEITPSGDMTLTAQWPDKQTPPAETLTVTCDPNGGKWDDGTSGKKPLEVEDGKPFIVPDAPTPPPGKEFGGWLDDKGNIHQPGGEITPSGDMTLTAQWPDKQTPPAETLTVTCDPNGGKWDDGTSGKKPLEVEDGKPFIVPDAPTPPPGKEFGGWLDDKGNIHQPGEEITPSGDMTLTAEWKDSKPGGDDKDPTKPGGNDKDPTKPGGDNKDPNKPGNNPSDKPSRPTKPNQDDKHRPSRPSRPKPSLKPDSEPSREPSGIKAGGTDGNGTPYRLLDGVYVAEEAYEQGYMYGFSWDKFGPDDYLTRAQFAAIMDRVFEFDEISITKSFQDTKGNWAEAHINRLASRSVIYGVNENEFRPNDGLTKGHVLLMLGRVLDLAKYSKVSNLTSVEQYHAREAIAQILNSGIYDDLDSNLDLNARITRSEMVHLMNNIIYGRNVKDTESERLISAYQMFPDLLSNPQHVFYDDCVKSLNDNYLMREVQNLEK